MKRVGLDARLSRQMSVGMKRYALEMCAKLPRVAPEFAYATFTQGGNFDWGEQVALPLAIAKAGVDLVHFLSQYTPLVVPVRSIVTLHDVIHLCFPQHFKRKAAWYYRFVVRRACARAARVITADERTVDDIERFLGVDRSKIRVVALGVDPQLFAPAPGASAHAGERPYLLYVGNHRRHKDLATLLEAWGSLPERYEVDLYMSGPDDFGGALERASTNRRHARVLGELSVPELAAYYRGASALVHPALREGFGLTLLEAMAAGTPVVVCADAVPAVLEEAVLTFAATDVRMLAERLAAVLDDQGLRARLVNDGQMLARKFTWDRCARATADVYREVLA
jgi:glycosyltransferase involved in cell wall biosynthesis